MKFVYALMFCAVVMVFSSCSATHLSSYDPAKKLPPLKLRQDLLVLKKVLEANHPSLYWYTPKDSVDGYFNSVFNSITDSLTELQFKNKVAWFVSKIRCGHTAVRTSKAYTNYFLKHRQPQFPLQLKVWGDSAVIVQNAFRNDSILKRGTIVTSINKQSNRELLDSMAELVGTDGYSNNFKQQLISFNYPYYYRNTFGLDSEYVIHFIDSSGRNATKTIKNFVPSRDTSARKVLTKEPRLTKKEIRKYNKLAKRRMTIDTSLNTAFINISTFSEGRLQGFFKDSFRKMKKEHVQNVVIDLRENSGGNVMSSTRLTQYLVDKPFHVADTVAAINRSLSYHRYIRPWFIYWLSMHIAGRKGPDGRIHFPYFERHYFKPKKRYHFDGHIYLVSGGFTFSASTLFIGALKGQENVTVVGEETGGGSYGNTAMHLPVMTLPTSKVRIVLPLFRMVIDKNRPKTGRGIFPDVEVSPSSTSIKRGVDPKMEKVKELIRAQQKVSEQLPHEL